MAELPPRQNLSFPLSAANDEVPSTVDTRPSEAQPSAKRTPVEPCVPDRRLTADSPSSHHVRYALPLRPVQVLGSVYGVGTATLRPAGAPPLDRLPRRLGLEASQLAAGEKDLAGLHAEMKRRLAA